jgi:hypothetical protein
MPGPRPLLNTSADQQLFVADESRQSALAAVEASNNVLVIGEPGSGKSSLLYRALAQARARDRPALLINGGHAEGSRQLIDILASEAVEQGWVPDAPRPESADPLGPARQLRRLRAAPSNALVLADDFTREQAISVFGQFRDELWQTPVNFVVAVGPNVAESLSRAPADVFFDRRVPLEPLSGDAAAELLRRRDQLGASTPVSILPQTSLQPRALLTLAAGETPERDLSPARQHELIALAERAAGRPGAMLLAEIWARDGVSASDPDLQHRLGVTRNRLTELLRTLESHGLLASHLERREGKTGRPRVIYAVRPR